MTGKKVLFFFPHDFFNSEHGCNIRAQQVVQWFIDNNYELTILSLYETGQSNFEWPGYAVGLNILDSYKLFLVDKKILFKILQSIMTNLRKFRFPFKTILLKKFLFFLRLSHKTYMNLLNKNDWMIFHYSYLLKKNFKKLILKEHYDVIYINYVYYSYLLDVVPAKRRKGMCIVIDTHDFVTINEFQRNNRAFSLVLKMLPWELLSLNRYDKIINISSFENQFFSNFFPEKCVELPVAFAENLNPLEEIEKIYDLIFVGSNNSFNIRSLQWFLDEIYPAFQHLKLVIIGNVANHVESHSANVIKMGFVQDLTRAYKQSKVAICPMIGGTGLKVKIVEALSHGLPVIASDVVRTGLSGFYEGAIYLAHDKQEFYECLYNIEEIKRKTDLVQKYFLSTYSKKSFHEKMEKIFDNIHNQGLSSSLQ